MSEDQPTDESTEPERADPTAIRFVGPATAEILDGADFDAHGITDKTVSYEMLIDAGVNPGVAARIRREHSLSWSFGGSGNDLDRRSTQIRGLKDDERAWIAASSGDWEEPETASTDGSGTPEDAERAWQERSRPEPVTTIPDVDAAAASRLARGGITSVRSLSIADPEEVVDSLGFDRARVVKWREAAREML